jgi:hypothetical protein
MNKGRSRAFRFTNSHRTKGRSRAFQFTNLQFSRAGHRNIPLKLFFQCSHLFGNCLDVRTLSHRITKQADLTVQPFERLIKPNDYRLQLVLVIRYLFLKD